MSTSVASESKVLSQIKHTIFISDTFYHCSYLRPSFSLSLLLVLVRFVVVDQSLRSPSELYQSPLYILREVEGMTKEVSVFVHVMPFSLVNDLIYIHTFTTRQHGAL